MQSSTARDVLARLSQFPGFQPQAIEPLTGGMIAAVYKVTLADGRDVVVKAGDADSRLDIEGDMLRHLAQFSELPLPPLFHSEPDLLVLGFVEGNSDLDERAQEHAAELLATLHSVTWTHFGHTQDTLIGPLHQPNPPSSSWVDFFREQRLLYMAHEALRAEAIDSSLCARIETLAGHLERWLDEARQPALVHGDVWATNLLASEGRITAFLDPAIYYAHEEIELAYTTLFGSRGRTFGNSFFRGYQELRPIAPGFFEERRHIYNLYPLLVHARVFGRHYPAEVARTLDRFGY
ncbi:MAG: fructosamine kinase family protein [Anaerolineaceae bacterium]|nr:fructosamine kinase family protein [Anaerolineaceae bacterium]